ncbi:hypothetical protein RP20_CCG006748 [Aedes albopictus]|nr:hypothetical protein RP20_CCG006748 [Aedes albopictus]
MTLRGVIATSRLLRHLRGSSAYVIKLEPSSSLITRASGQCQQQYFRTIYQGKKSQKAVSVSVSELGVESSTTAIRSAICLRQKGDELLVVELVNGQKHEFPLVWLRDNCQCSGCFHPGSHSRILNWELFDVDKVQVKECSVDDDGGRVQILWSDGHASEFTSEWLVERNFSEENSKEYLEELYRPPPQLWRKQEFGDIMKNFEFKDVINSDDALRGWIEALIRYGTVMIKNAPLTEQECRRLAERVGFIRKTHYG